MREPGTDGSGEAEVDNYRFTISPDHDIIEIEISMRESFAGEV
jgi:hypothetical protein